MLETLVVICLYLGLIGLILGGFCFILYCAYCFLKLVFTALRVAWEMVQDRKYRRDERKGIEEG
jgi:hypothetical protein